MSEQTKHPHAGQPKKEPTEVIALRVPEKHKDMLYSEFRLIVFCLVLIDELEERSVLRFSAQNSFDKKNYEEIIIMLGDQLIVAPEEVSESLSKHTIKKLKHYYEILK